MTIYVDCNATTPLDDRVGELVLRYLLTEYGNAGSRTHEHGMAARRAVQRAREQVAAVVETKPDEVVFTSGATESNNLALLGLADFGRREGRTHLVSTSIEHKAVLEPLEALQARGFEVTIVLPTAGGWVDPSVLRAAVRPDTLCVSIMQVNNETGIIQPVEQIAELLGDHPAYLHVDAAQGFGKVDGPLRHPRIDLISLSGHKVHAPKGVGALVTRRRGYERPPLAPLMFGGGQERGLRPGTVPVALVAGLGLAAELAAREQKKRHKACLAFGDRLRAALAPLGPVEVGDPDRRVATTLSMRLPGIHSEAVMLALKGLVAISNGAACTSASYTTSHVLTAMGMAEREALEATRWSWCHFTPEPDWGAVRGALEGLR